MGNRPRSMDPPEPQNPGYFEPWECAFQRSHVPPVDPEADKLFKEARLLQEQGGLTAFEEERMIALYTEAAEKGHWKAMNNLAACYLYGQGVEQDYVAANKLFDQLVVADVGAGHFGKYLLHKNGWGVDYDRKKAEQYRHKAADLGMPQAQYELGYKYLYPERRDKQGILYMICAARQGHSEALYNIGKYLDMKKNFYMATEYLYRAAALGHLSAAFALRIEFNPENTPEVSNSYGFVNKNSELHKFFADLVIQLKKSPGTRTPDLFKNHPFPENVKMTREQSRAMPSLLKDAFDGLWPDDIFPELALDYMPPEE